VQFRVDGASFGTEVLVPPYEVLWDTTGAVGGRHTLTAVARDAAGNQTASSAITVVVSNPVSAPPTNGLVLYYDFESDFSGGVVQDLSGAGNNALGFSLSHWPSSTAGVVGLHSALFSGVAAPQYMAVTNWNGIGFMPSGAISLWAQFSTNSYENSTLLDAGDTGHPNSWHLSRVESSNVRFVVFDSSGNPQVKVNFPDDVVYNGVTPTYATANWHNYGISWDGSNIIGYYDGVAISTNSLGVPNLQIVSGGHWMAIGTRQRDGTPQWGDDPYPSAYWFGGSLDDLRMYNRALTPLEFQAIYKSRNRAPGLTPPSFVRVIGLGG
jgi:hypothetical protein